MASRPIIVSATYIGKLTWLGLLLLTKFPQPRNLVIVVSHYKSWLRFTDFDSFNLFLSADPHFGHLSASQSPLASVYVLHKTFFSQYFLFAIHLFPPCLKASPWFKGVFQTLLKNSCFDTITQEKSGNYWHILWMPTLNTPLCHWSERINAALVLNLTPDFEISKHSKKNTKKAKRLHLNSLPHGFLTING